MLLGELHPDTNGQPASRVHGRHYSTNKLAGELSHPFY